MGKITEFSDQKYMCQLNEDNIYCLFCLCSMTIETLTCIVCFTSINILIAYLDAGLIVKYADPNQPEKLNI